MTKIDNNTLKLEDKEVFIFGITVGINELYNHLKVRGKGAYDFMLNEKFKIPEEEYEKIKSLSAEIIDILRDVHIKEIVEKFKSDGWSEEELKKHIKWED